MLPGKGGLARCEVGLLLGQIQLARAVQRLPLRLLLRDARFARGERLLPLGQARDPFLGGALEIGLGLGQLGLALVQALLLGPEALEGRAETLFHICRERVEIGRALHLLDLLRRLLRIFQFLRLGLGRLGPAAEPEQQDEEEQQQDDEDACEQEEMVVALERGSRHAPIIAARVATIALL